MGDDEPHPFFPSADLFSPGQSRQVSLAYCPNLTHFSQNFVGLSLCIGAQSWESQENDFCFKGKSQAGDLPRGSRPWNLAASAGG